MPQLDLAQVGITRVIDNCSGEAFLGSGQLRKLSTAGIVSSKALQALHRNREYVLRAVEKVCLGTLLVGHLGPSDYEKSTVTQTEIDIQI